MLPISSNPDELEMDENPKKKRKRRGCHRVKGYRRCTKGRRKGKKSHRRGSGKIHIKRGKGRLLTFKAAKARYGAKGANAYRRKFGVRKLKG